MGQDWSDSSLPWLDMVFLCVDGVGLKQVSWAVRYLDKPRWRAVAAWFGPAVQPGFAAAPHHCAKISSWGNFAAAASAARSCNV